MRNPCKITLIVGKVYCAIKVATFDNRRNVQSRRQYTSRPNARKLKKKRLFLITSFFITFIYFCICSPSFCQSQPFQFEGTPTCLHVCSLQHVSLALEAGETVVSFNIAYTSELKPCVFALALRVPHCACAEPEIAVLDGAWR